MGFHTELEYSSVGLTSAVYALLLISCRQLWRLSLIRMRV